MHAVHRCMTALTMAGRKAIPATTGRPSRSVTSPGHSLRPASHIVSHTTLITLKSVTCQQEYNKSPGHSLRPASHIKSQLLHKCNKSNLPQGVFEAVGVSCAPAPALPATQLSCHDCLPQAPYLPQCLLAFPSHLPPLHIALPHLGNYQLTIGYRKLTMRCRAQQPRHSGDL
jgi:hypothetical protein